MDLKKDNKKLKEEMNEIQDLMVKLKIDSDGKDGQIKELITK